MTKPSLRILVADDCPVLRELYREVFEPLGADVTAVADGAAALERCGESTFDLVVTDHEMPFADGPTVVRTLRARGFSGPIAVVSGALTPTLVNEYRRAGATTLLAKPFSLRALHALVESHPVALCAA